MPERPTLEEVFAEHAPYVWRTVRFLGVRPADIEDVCQEVFVVVHRRLPSFEGRSQLRTWLYGICVRVASQHRRRAWVRRETPGAMVEERAAERVTDAGRGRAEARLTLEALLDELDDDKRQVVVLYEIEQLPMREVAEIVGCPLQTAYSRLHAARRALADAARRSEGGD